MLSIHVRNSTQDQHLEHAGGPLEFGRGPRRQVARIVLESMFVSRDHLELEELPSGRIRVRNLSRTKDVKLSDGSSLLVGGYRELALPLGLAVGDTTITVGLTATEPFDKTTFQTLHEQVRDARGQPVCCARKAVRGCVWF